MADDKKRNPVTSDTDTDQQKGGEATATDQELVDVIDEDTEVEEDAEVTEDSTTSTDDIEAEKEA